MSGDGGGSRSYEAMLATLRPKQRRAWVGWLCVTVLALLGAGVYVLQLWHTRVMALDFQAHEAGLYRTCIENGGVYSAGSCGVPAVQFSIIPFRAHDDSQPGTDLPLSRPDPNAPGAEPKGRPL